MLNNRLQVALIGALFVIAALAAALVVLVMDDSTVSPAQGSTEPTNAPSSGTSAPRASVTRQPPPTASPEPQSGGDTQEPQPTSPSNSSSGSGGASPGLAASATTTETSTPDSKQSATGTATVPGTQTATGTPTHTPTATPTRTAPATPTRTATTTPTRTATSTRTPTPTRPPTNAAPTATEVPVALNDAPDEPFLIRLTPGELPLVAGQVGAISFPLGDKEDHIRIVIDAEDSAMLWRIKIVGQCGGPGIELAVWEINGLQYPCSPLQFTMFELPVAESDGPLDVRIRLLGAPPGGAFVQWKLGAFWSSMDPNATPPALNGI